VNSAKSVLQQPIPRTEQNKRRKQCTRVGTHDHRIVNLTAKHSVLINVITLHYIRVI